MTLLELLQEPAIQFMMKSGRQPELIARSRRDGIEWTVERAYLEGDAETGQLIIEIAP